MRRIFKSFMLVAAAAMAFTSCQKEEVSAPETVSVNLTMHAGVEETKTFLGENNEVLWGKGEAVKLYVGAGETPKFVSSKSTDAYENEATASFEFSISDVETSSSYNLGGIYPASAAVNNNENPAKFKVTLPDVQTAEVGKYDPSAYIMVLKPETVETLPTEYQASFRRATALNKITLTGVKENITSVEITVPEGKDFAGRRYFNLIEGTSGDIYYGQTSTITVNAPYTGESIDVWFCSWGVELAAGEELTVKMCAAENTYTRTITAKDNGITFAEGKLNTLKISMADINPDEQEKPEQPEQPDGAAYYEKVTSAPADWSGKYLIVYETGENAYVFNGKDEVNGYVAAKISDNKIASTSEIDAVAVTIEPMSGGYAIKTSAGYIYGNSSSNKLSFDSSQKLNTIEYSSTNDVTITSGRVLRFNNASNQMRYRYYSSGTQQPIQLYRLAASNETPDLPDTTPSVTLETEELELTADESEGTIGVVAKNIELIEVRALAAEGSQDESDWLIVEYDEEKSCIAYLADANESEEPRRAYIEVYCLDADGNEVVAGVNVTQEGVVDESDLPVGITSIYDAITSESNATLDEFSVSLTDAVVTYVNGNSAFVEDATAGILIYKSGHGLVAGDKLNGVLTGKGYVRYGVCQITEFDMTNITKETGATIPYVEIAVADLLSDYASYVSRRVKIVDATITDGIAGTSDKNGAVSQNGSSVNLYNNTSVNFVETEVVDFYAYPSYYNTTKQLATWEAPTTKKVATPVIACASNVVTITCGTAGASLYYAIGDGEFAAYTEGVEIDETVTIKAYATKSGLADSEVASQECEYVDLNTQPTTTDAELSFANKAQRTSFSSSQQVWEQNGITFTNDKASSSNAVADYAQPVRLYAGSKVTIAAPGNITKIVFDANSGSYATAMKNSIGTVSGATVSVSSDKVTVTFANATASSFVVAKLTAQVRLDSITVTYQN